MNRLKESDFPREMPTGTVTSFCFVGVVVVVVSKQGLLANVVEGIFAATKPKTF